jgi:hypothetical protein
MLWLCALPAVHNRRTARFLLLLIDTTTQRMRFLSLLARRRIQGILHFQKKCLTITRTVVAFLNDLVKM